LLAERGLDITYETVRRRVPAIESKQALIGTLPIPSALLT
jgi:hypothetical protein